MKALLDDGEPPEQPKPEQKPVTPPEAVQEPTAAPGDLSEPSKKFSEHVTTPKTSVRPPVAKAGARSPVDFTSLVHAERLADLVNSSFEMPSSDRDFKLTHEQLIKVCKILLHMLNFSNVKIREQGENLKEEIDF